MLTLFVFDITVETPDQDSFCFVAWQQARVTRLSQADHQGLFTTFVPNNRQHVSLQTAYIVFNVL